MKKQAMEQAKWQTQQKMCVRRKGADRFTVNSQNAKRTSSTDELCTDTRYRGRVEHHCVRLKMATNAAITDLEVASWGERTVTRMAWF